MPTVYLHDKPIPIEPDDILSDGGSVRVPMMLRDGVGDAAKKNRKRKNEDDDLEEDKANMNNTDSMPMHVTDAFGNSGLALSQPGYRLAAAGQNTADHAAAVTARHMADAAYRDANRANSEAWRRDASEYTGGEGYSVYTGYGSRRVQELPPGAYPFAPHLVGAACTINGKPGRLKEKDGYLVCEVGSADAAMDDRAMAYAEGVDAMQNAWKRKPQR